MTMISPCPADVQQWDERAAQRNSPRNQLLAALPAGERVRLMPHLKHVSLEAGQVLYRPNEPTEHVYFLNDGLVSLVLTSQEGIEVEASIIGHEGMVGILAVLGGSPGTTAAQVQIAGTAWQAPVRLIEDELRSNQQIDYVLICYLQTLYNQSAQNALCNKVHPTLERLSRWLLLVSDRVGSETFDLHEEFIAHMLGVEFAKAHHSIEQLQSAGTIGYDYSQGHLTIRDRHALEECSCGCHKVITSLLNQLQQRFAIAA
jgi:CRP-like cAMP-binding protein